MLSARLFCGAVCLLLVACQRGSRPEPSGDPACRDGADSGTSPQDPACAPAECGDGVVNGKEECDPRASDSSPFNCSPTCTRISAYTPCKSDSDCLGGTVCYLGMCSRPCSVSSDCDTVADHPDLGAFCPVPRGYTCAVPCESNDHCPMPGAMCNGGQVCQTI